LLYAKRLLETLHFLDFGGIDGVAIALFFIVPSVALWQSQRASFYGFVGGKSIARLWPLLTNPQTWHLLEPSFSMLES